MNKKDLVYAIHKYSRISSKKMAIVMNLVRGKSYAEAERILTFDTTKGAKLLLKALKSAAANAVNNKNIKKDGLIVADLRVDGGPMFKRAHLIGKGRINPILKRTSHITVGLRERRGK